MQVFLETERLILRRFTEADVDNLFDLDSDPEVMRYLTGGATTPRDVIEHDILPHFLDYYAPYTGFGFWAVVEKATGSFWGGFTFARPKAAIRTKPNSATVCVGSRGARATPPKDRER